MASHNRQTSGDSYTRCLRTSFVLSLWTPVEMIYMMGSIGFNMLPQKTRAFPGDNASTRPEGTFVRRSSSRACIGRHRFLLSSLLFHTILRLHYCAHSIKSSRRSYFGAQMYGRQLNSDYFGVNNALEMPTQNTTANSMAQAIVAARARPCALGSRLMESRLFAWVHLRLAINRFTASVCSPSTKFETTVGIKCIKTDLAQNLPLFCYEYDCLTFEPRIQVEMKMVS